MNKNILYTRKATVFLCYHELVTYVYMIFVLVEFLVAGHARMPLNFLPILAFQLYSVHWARLDTYIHEQNGRATHKFILDLHVSHVGGEAQQNILSILLWARSQRGRKTLSGLSQVKNSQIIAKLKDYRI